MAAGNVGEEVRRAWQQQRDGNSAAAMDAFETIVQAHPEDIDARYGLGISQKAAGHKDKAIQSFREALALVESGQQAQDAQKASSSEDTIRTPEDDRLTMLARMLNQRIAETEGGG
ncbi:MAG: tetratricopeptide repeat protein, partial [Anaerolineaceae bacterium]|nr:tetratricopeptide repeat protein [Anaerolineaceae bacterium]MCY3906959.1 tetratricopeptide repeat protein [Anaerolineaceae bacterium]